jgi:hypothetical protein
VERNFASLVLLGINIYPIRSLNRAGGVAFGEAMLGIYKSLACSIKEKGLLNPSTIGGCLLNPFTYKTMYSTPQTIKNHLNNP